MKVCEQASTGGCAGEVGRRPQVGDLCWRHYLAELARRNVAERAASIAIRDAIHKRDGIVLGCTPIGTRCKCRMCMEEAY